MVAEEDVEILALGVQDIDKVLGSSLEAIMIRNKIRSNLLRCEEFKILSPSFIDLVLDCFKIKYFEQN